MPHYSNYGGTRFSAQPEKESFHTPFGTARFKESFGSFEPRDVESVDIGQPPDPEIGGLKGEFQADELTGEGRPMNSWTNGSATSFEDRWEFLDTGYDLNVVGFGNRIDADIQRPTHPNDNIGTNSGPGGSSYMTAESLVFPGLYDLAGYEGSGTATCSNLLSPGFDAGRNEHGIIIDNPGTAPHIGGTSGPGGSSYMTETFEPLAGMNSFGESLNPVLEIGGQAGPGGTSYMTGSIGCQTMPPCSITGSAGPGGDDI